MGRLILLLLIASCAAGADVGRLIWLAESDGRLVAPTSVTGARGPLQIKRSYWLDSGLPGTWAMCDDAAYAMRVVDAYYARFGRGGHPYLVHYFGRTWRTKSVANPKRTAALLARWNEVKGR